VPDYPLLEYLVLLDFICGTRGGTQCGSVEISLRGETIGGA